MIVATRADVYSCCYHVCDRGRYVVLVCVCVCCQTLLRRPGRQQLGSQIAGGFALLRLAHWVEGWSVCFSFLFGLAAHLAAREARACMKRAAESKT